MHESSFPSSLLLFVLLVLPSLWLPEHVPLGLGFSLLLLMSVLASLTAATPADAAPLSFPSCCSLNLLSLLWSPGCWCSCSPSSSCCCSRWTPDPSVKAAEGLRVSVGTPLPDSDDDSIVAIVSEVRSDLIVSFAFRNSNSRTAI